MSAVVDCHRLPTHQTARSLTAISLEHFPCSPAFSASALLPWFPRGPRIPADPARPPICKVTIEPGSRRTRAPPGPRFPILYPCPEPLTPVMRSGQSCRTVNAQVSAVVYSHRFPTHQPARTLTAISLGHFPCSPALFRLCTASVVPAWSPDPRGSYPASHHRARIPANPRSSRI